MTERFHSSASQAGLAILACLLWSTAFVGVKIGLTYVGPFAFAGIRFALSGIILLPFCGRPAAFFRTVSSNWKMILQLSFFQTFLLYGMFYVGMTLIPGALGAIVIGSGPLLSAVTAHFLMPDDTMTRAKSISIAIGLLGVAVISLSRQPWQATGLMEFVGVVLLVLGGVCSAFGNIIVARDEANVPPLILNAVQIFFGGVLLLVISLPLEGLPDLNQPIRFYLILLWLSFLSAVAISIWFFLLKKPGVKVSELNLWKFLIPVGGAIFSWTFLPAESPEAAPVIGMICVAGAVLWYHAVAPVKKQQRADALAGDPPV